MSNVQHAATDAVSLLWNCFKRESRWPSKKEFLLLIDREQLALDTIRSCSRTSFGAGGDEQVSARFEALVTLPEVRELLAPLPAVLRDAAAAFVAQAPLLPDTDRPTLHFRQIKGHWSDPSRARIAVDVLRSTGSGILDGGGSSGGDPDDFWFSLGIDCLQYEHVQTLDEVLRIDRHHGVSDVGQSPTGKHLELLRRIYATSKSEQRWPSALPFAVAARDLGFVPHLARDLGRRFLRDEFQPSHHSLVLTSQSLPFVDPSGDDRRLFVEAVRGIVDIWRSRNGIIEILLGELASAVHVSAERLGPVAAFLDWSGWCHLGHSSDDSHLHLVIVPGDPELVLRNKNVQTFDEYMSLWNSPGDEHPSEAAHALPANEIYALTAAPPVSLAASQAAPVAAAVDRRAASDPQFKYDVAISFAGPQRPLAEALARAVRHAGFEVFFDDFYPDQLWGKDLTVFFDDVFRKDARFCVMFISKEYANRMWTTRERQSAMARAVQERGKEYILPVQIEDAEIPGLSPTIGYISLATYTIEEIAELLKKKLKAK